MSPSFMAGDFVLVWRGFWQKVDVDDVVVVAHPEFGKIIKRVSRVLPSGKIHLKGDNFLESTSEVGLGACKPEHLIGKVVSRISTGLY